MAGFTTMMANQQRETRALSETLAALELQRAITSTVADSSACTALLASANIAGGSSALTFNANSLSSANPRIINFNQIAGASPGAPASPISSSLSVQNSGGIQLQVVSPSNANLVVNFDQSRLVRSIKNLTFSNIPIATTGPLNATLITGCGSVGIGSNSSGGTPATAGTPTLIDYSKCVNTGGKGNSLPWPKGLDRNPLSGSCPANFVLVAHDVGKNVSGGICCPLTVQ